MKSYDKKFNTVLAILVILLTVIIPMLFNMESQGVFGLSNSFLAGFIGVSSIFGLLWLVSKIARKNSTE